MITTIDHNVRRSLGILSSDYIVIDYLAKLDNADVDFNIDQMSTDVGLSNSLITNTITKMRVTDPALIVEVGKRYVPSSVWYQSFVNPPERVGDGFTKKAYEVIDLFNQMNGTRFNRDVYADSIKKIIKDNPSVTIDHFGSVFAHKKEVWGNDPTMVSYNKPMTLFRNSKRFMQYLDEALLYWKNKSKLNQYERTAEAVRN